MTTTDALLQELTLQGIRLWPEAGKLRYAGPQQHITPELLQLLKQHKDALLHSLSEPRDFPLSYGQQGLWSIHQLAPENSAYNVSLAYQLHGPLNVKSLSNVIQLLVNRHAALRTRFVWRDGVPVQRVDGYQAATVEEFEAPGWTDDAIHRELNALHARPFDLERGPLFRVTILRHGEEHFSLLLSVHHIVIDGWSLYQLIDELFAFYHALQSGTTVDLPTIQYTYADYVTWQQQLLQTDEERLWDFWQAQLQGELPVLQLPADYSRPAQQSFRGISQSIHVPFALTARLKTIARQNDCTLYVVLLSRIRAFSASPHQPGRNLGGTPDGRA